MLSKAFVVSLELAAVFQGSQISVTNEYLGPPPQANSVLHLVLSNFS